MSAYLQDIHGKRYRSETWYASANNATENRDMRKVAFLTFDPRAIVSMKRVIVDEHGEKIAEPIDLGESLIIPQPDGRYNYQKK